MKTEPVDPAFNLLLSQKKEKMESPFPPVSEDFVGEEEIEESSSVMGLFGRLQSKKKKPADVPVPFYLTERPLSIMDASDDTELRVSAMDVSDNTEMLVSAIDASDDTEIPLSTIGASNKIEIPLFIIGASDNIEIPLSIIDDTEMPVSVIHVPDSAEISLPVIHTEDPFFSLAAPLLFLNPVPISPTKETAGAAPVTTLMCNAISATCLHMERKRDTTTLIRLSYETIGDVEVKIVRYDTDPTTFHIAITTLPHALKEMSLAAIELQKALQTVLPEMRFAPIVVTLQPFTPTKQTVRKKRDCENEGDSLSFDKTEEKSDFAGMV